MAASLGWETVLRAGGAHSLSQRGCRRGWSVAIRDAVVRLYDAVQEGRDIDAVLFQVTATTARRSRSVL